MYFACPGLDKKYIYVLVFLRWSWMYQFFDMKLPVCYCFANVLVAPVIVNDALLSTAISHRYIFIFSFLVIESMTSDENVINNLSHHLMYILIYIFLGNKGIYHSMVRIRLWLNNKITAMSKRYLYDMRCQNEMNYPEINQTVSGIINETIALYFVKFLTSDRSMGLLVMVCPSHMPCSSIVW